MTTIDAEEIILEMLQRTGPCNLDDLVTYLPTLSWSEVFAAIDRMSRDGLLLLRRLGPATYQIALSSQSNLRHHISEFDSPTYVLDLRNKLNCLRIESAQPGEEIQVLVRPKHDHMAKPVLAKGMLSQDGASFSVVITRADGTQESYPLIYANLMKALSY
jgi:hypothetical protein